MNGEMALRREKYYRNAISKTAQVLSRAPSGFVITIMIMMMQFSLVSPVFSRLPSNSRAFRKRSIALSIEKNSLSVETYRRAIQYSIPSYGLYDDVRRDYSVQ